MKIVDFEGLNCYHSCILTAAAELGAAYEPALSALWSERDFFYDPDRKVFLTLRLPEGLKDCGAELSELPCGRDAENSLGLFSVGEACIVGMDAFDVPWTPIYGLQRGPHYFIATVSAGENFLCADTTYRVQNAALPRRVIAEKAFTLHRLVRTKAAEPLPLKEALVLEARRVLTSHTQTAEEFSKKITDCANDRAAAVSCARYADALIRNRLMYREYLRFSQAERFCPLFFDKRFFSLWTAVKNGLYKISCSENPAALFREVRTLSESLFRKEEALAESALR